MKKIITVGSLFAGIGGIMSESRDSIFFPIEQNPARANQFKGGSLNGIVNNPMFFRTTAENQIAVRVIALQAIDVVNSLTFSCLAADSLLNNQDVFRSVCHLPRLGGSANHHVPPMVDKLSFAESIWKTTLPKWFAAPFISLPAKRIVTDSERASNRTERFAFRKSPLNFFFRELSISHSISPCA